VLGTRSRPRALAIVISAALLISAVGAAAATIASRRGGASSPPELGANAQRFLDLTGGDQTTGQASSQAAAADGEQSAAAIEGNYTPNGFRIRPAGTQVPVFNFPLGLAAAPDGHVIVSSDSGGMQGLSTIDPASLTSTQTPAANLFIGLAVTDDERVLASGGNADRIFRFRQAGSTLVSEDATETATFPNHNARDGIISRIPGSPSLPASDGVRVKGYPGASVLDGKLLYIAGTLAEPTGTGSDLCPDEQTACSRITILDTTTDTVVARVPVGLDAFGLALDRDRDLLYVTNWADEAGRGGAEGGTVSVVDIADARSAHEIAHAGVGHHPSAIQLSAARDRLFVANTNDDTITVFEVDAEGMLGSATTESVQPHSGAQIGAHPDAFALSPDGSTLFVALAGLNAVEVRNGHTGAPMKQDPVYIPTGWYPSALLVTDAPGDGDGYRLWVANAKGAGAATSSTGMNLSIGHEIDPLTGTVSVIDLPDAEREADWTQQVADNDRLEDFDVDPCNPGDGITVSEVLCPAQGSSPVKHVVYIVTENKTFDQYFGDLDASRYDVDPKYLLYGQPVTPNHHSLADRYSLSDRFFSDAQVSVTGHSWTSGAIATDHNEKTFEADYDEGIRGNHGNGDPLKPGVGGSAGGKISEAENELDDPEGGYIFEAFKRAGAVAPLVDAPAGDAPLSMAIYGESTALESGDMNAYKAPGWKDGDLQYFDTCRAQQFIAGVAADGPGPNSPEQFQDCGGRTLPAQFNLKHWTEVHDATGVDIMPSFIYMSLPVNHTLGTNLGSPTPASMVADNDHAIGLITEALSNSPFWESTVIMQTEDDTQAAGDHISPLRDYLQVIGPWAKPGANHQWGSMPSLLRAIEQIFQVEPISLFDRLALPQHGAFRQSLSDTPDLTPYTAIRPAVPFGLNEPGAQGQAESMAMDWRTYDLIDEATLNAILYAVARGVPFVAPS
jgi:DNA-binding beta-propeller fold protein YncE